MLQSAEVFWAHPVWMWMNGVLSLCVCAWCWTGSCGPLEERKINTHPPPAAWQVEKVGAERRDPNLCPHHGTRHQMMLWFNHSPKKVINLKSIPRNRSVIILSGGQEATRNDGPHPSLVSCETTQWWGFRNLCGVFRAPTPNWELVPSGKKIHQFPHLQTTADQSAAALLAERMQDHGGERQVASRWATKMHPEVPETGSLYRILLSAEKDR